MGRPLTIVARLGEGIACRVQSPAPLAPAVRHALSAELLARQLGRLGGTHYQLRKLEARIIAAPMVPLSVLGKLRHEIVRRLDAAAAQPAPRRIAAEAVLPVLRAALGPFHGVGPPASGRADASRALPIAGPGARGG